MSILGHIVEVRIDHYQAKLRQQADRLQRMEERMQRMEESLERTERLCGHLLRQAERHALMQPQMVMRQTLTEWHSRHEPPPPSQPPPGPDRSW